MEGICLATLGWLTGVPAGDTNFVNQLKQANAATVRAALEQVPAGYKTKTKALETRLRKLEKEEGMAPKIKEPRAHDVEAAAATEIYQVAKADAEQQLTAMREEIGAIREESQAMGALTAIDANIAYNEFLRAVTLQRIKQAKEYKKGGLTWVEFCDSLGLVSRTVDMMLADIRPLIETFSEKFSGFCGMPFSKIRLLGKTISENLSEIKDGCLVYGDESIPLTPEYRDDIQALIERIGEEAKENINEAEDKLAAKDKVLKMKQKEIDKNARDLARYERQAKAKGLSPEEDSLLAKIEALGVELNGYCLKLETVRDAIIEHCFPSTIAAFINLTDNVRMKTSCFRESAVDTPGTRPLR